MASDYTGQITGIQPPGPNLEAGATPIVSLPDDGDALNAASVAQAFKENTDFNAYIMNSIQLTPPQEPSTGDFTPQAKWISSLSTGLVRNVIDHNGYPIDTNTTFNENWVIHQTSTSASPLTGNAWTFARTGTGVYGFLDYSTIGVVTNDWLGPHFSMSVSTANNDDSFLHTTNAPVQAAANLDCVMSWSHYVTGTLTNNTYNIGLTASGFGSSSILFRKDSSDTHWQCVTQSAVSETVTNSSVLANAAIAHKFKIEFHGANTDWGIHAGGNVVLFFIDGGLVATHTANVATPLNGYLVGMEAKQGASSTTTSIVVSPIRTIWNQYLSTL